MEAEKWPLEPGIFSISINLEAISYLQRLYEFQLFDLSDCPLWILAESISPYEDWTEKVGPGIFNHCINLKDISYPQSPFEHPAG